MSEGSSGGVNDFTVGVLAGGVFGDRFTECPWDMCSGLEDWDLLVLSSECGICLASTPTSSW